jgi:hypothetical protein
MTENEARVLVGRKTIEQSNEDQTTSVAVRYGRVNRDGWKSGPWDNEPDDEGWVDEATGLRCYVSRMHNVGHLCGYVEVPESIARDESLQSLGCHGGVTFGPASFQDGVTAIGFNCNHYLDTAPMGHSLCQREFGEHPSYRDWAYVKWNVTTLARQVKELADKAEDHANGS